MAMDKKIVGEVFEAERSLYGLRDVEVAFCHFGGPLDGESPLKEGRNLYVHDSDFGIRYPLWHLESGKLENVHLGEGARAGLWYARDVDVLSSKIEAVKFARECDELDIVDSFVRGDEFGWKCHGLRLSSTKVEGIYSLLDSDRIEGRDFHQDGRYSMQYVRSSTFTGCSFKGRDAFWHAKDVVIADSRLEGEYLAWYSENLTLIRCTIDSHQPLCYCRNLTLVDCRFSGESDLAFENSDVHGNVLGGLGSVKNLRSGELLIEKETPIVDEDDVYEVNGKISFLGD